MALGENCIGLQKRNILAVKSSNVELDNNFNIHF